MRNNLMRSSKTCVSQSGALPVLRMLLGVMAIAMAYPASAQKADPLNLVMDNNLPDRSLRADLNLREIVVETDRNNLPADGRAVVNAQIRLLDEKGQLLQGTTYVVVENSGGKILEAQRNKKLGPGMDMLNTGAQIKVENGIGKFTLVAPTYAQDVKLRVYSGRYEALGIVSFLPDLRPMIVSGLVEGVISRRPAQDPNAPTRFNDGFEQDITRWSRQFDNGRTSVAERAAFFAKGEVGDGMLLTAAYDSDKASYSRLLKDIDTNKFYPVYGDTSVVAFDAQSSDRLYLRLDDKKSYVLYGDFSTGNGFTQITTGGAGIDPQINKLGQYNRTATGLRGHYEDGRWVANGFAINDTLKQVVEEYPANGTSGPFTVKNNTAIQNSEQVQLLIRDKNQINIIKQVIVMQRYIDYTFDPLSGRILFNQPIAALSPDGDPQSIRITYEVDQGGEKFWVVGADGKFAVTDKFSIGASVVDDQNPQSPYKLQSVGAFYRFSPYTNLVLEMARTTSTTYTDGTSVSPTPTGAAGEISSENTGNAERLEFNHKDEQTELRAYWLHADQYFNNTSAGLAGGHSEAGVSGKYALDERTRIYAEFMRSEDQASDADRSGERVGVWYALSDKLSVQLSLQHMKDNGNFTSGATIAPNTAALGTGQNPTGGFYGTGSAGLDPVTGQPLSPTSSLGNGNTTPSNIQYSGMDATTAKVGAIYKVSDALTINGDLEHSISGDDKYRYGLGAQYALGQGSRLYARAETQSGLASSYSLNPSDRSSSFIAGVDTSYMPGGTLFSEYRMLNALDTSLNDEHDNELASGVRNSWKLSDALNVNTSVEFLKVLSGSQQQAIALSGGADYHIDPQSTVSAKLEYRHLYDNSDMPGDQSQNQWLSTLSYARKISQDWTLLTRNYLMLQINHDDASGNPIGNTFQDRAQIGFAWRPRDNNLVNGLARYEYKTVRDHSQVNGDDYVAHILSGHLDYHPQRAWWMNVHAAAKLNTDYTLPAGQQKYDAALLSGRVIYDLSAKWDIGLLLASLYSPQGSGRQYAYGAELGYQVVKNMYVSVGYNVSGFTDQDLTGSDYTAHGVFLRLRYKFDENSFKSKTRD
jgi:hypothetical protein